MCVPAQYGGLGVLSIEDCLKESVLYCFAYVWCTESFATTRILMSKLADRHSRNLLSDATKICKDDLVAPLAISEDPCDAGLVIDGVRYLNATQAARKLVRPLRKVWDLARLKEWKSQVSAGRTASAEYIDQELSYLWIQKGYINGIAFRNVLAAQEGCLYTRVLAHKDKKCTNICRQCHKVAESVEHVVACCERFRPTLMVARHDSLVRFLHKELCRKYDLQTVHFTQKVDPFVENDRAKIYYDFNVVLRQQVRHNLMEVAGSG